MKTKSLLVIILVFSILQAQGQHSSDIGLFGGLTRYWGADIKNQKLIMQDIQSDVGIFYRWNINKLLGLRLQIFGGDLGAWGNLKNPALALPDNRSGTYIAYNGGIYFSRQFSANELILEFNFHNIIPRNKTKKILTPFAEVGLGSLTILYTRLAFTVPLGAGLKIDITKRLGGMVEFVLRKPDSNYIDGLHPSNINNGEVFSFDRWFNSTDYYATLNIGLCYKLTLPEKGL